LKGVETMSTEDAKLILPESTGAEAII